MKEVRKILVFFLIIIVLSAVLHHGASVATVEKALGAIVSDIILVIKDPLGTKPATSGGR